MERLTPDPIWFVVGTLTIGVGVAIIYWIVRKVRELR